MKLFCVILVKNLTKATYNVCYVYGLFGLPYFFVELRSEGVRENGKKAKPSTPP
jgi:hypothetical protein